MHWQVDKKVIIASINSKMNEVIELQAFPDEKEVVCVRQAI